MRPSAIPSAYKVGDDQLRVCVDSYPRPNIAPSLLLLFRSDVFRFRAHEAPNLVGLQAAHFQIPHSPIVVRGARAAQIGEEFHNRVLRNSRHADGGANRAAFNQAVDHFGAGFSVQAIHTDSYTIAALACQGEKGYK